MTRLQEATGYPVKKDINTIEGKDFKDRRKEKDRTERENEDKVKS